jgi:hypothetical protein
MASFKSEIGFHDGALDYSTATLPSNVTFHSDPEFTYKFENFFHPFVGELIKELNQVSLPGMLDAKFHEKLKEVFFETSYPAISGKAVEVLSFPKEIDVSLHGPYSNYNWELFFHIPMTVAVHLSKTQRFAEAERWFHYIFDPTSHDKTVEAPAKRFWKFLAFRHADTSITIDEILRVLGTPHTKLSSVDQSLQEDVLEGYTAIRNKPFQPHAVARTRHIAYQYCVVMKYLDNLIAWGDSLFQQDTMESINEATQRYVLAANVLGQRPQRIPPRGKVQGKTFAQLKNAGLGPIGNALVELEGQVPFNLAPLKVGSGDGSGGDALFGIGRTLYFCIPRNDKMLGYWDTIADRLFKIRHCMNIEGIVRPLALFDPPIDPGMLVKAAAAGIDIGSIVNGLNQPVGPVRSQVLIQKALELCGEVRNLGSALLSALEKGDAEHLAVVRQGHEIQIQTMSQEVRFLQWKSAQEATTSLLTSRATALERLHYYQRLLGLPADSNAPDTLTIDHSVSPDSPPKLTEENFDEAYSALVGQFDKTLTLQKLPDLKMAGDMSPAQQSGASGSGRLYLTVNEDAELNTHLPAARDTGLASSVVDMIGSGMVFIPDAKGNLHFWGLGGTIDIKVGTAITKSFEIASKILKTISTWHQEQAGMAARTAGHERRTDDWVLQHNLAAHELMQIGRQILTSLIAEQIAHHEYRTIRQQIANAQEVDQLLRDKFTNEELYGWMQGEISRLYYEYYRFAFDTARKAERTMKQELMRSELDAQDFVKFNYWDGGRKGLLSGEALQLDVKRMEMAYHDQNKRELELARHVSVRQLDPLALLTLKATGSCTLTIPEWLYDRDCPGHYMRRIKSVALSLPSVVGPYTSVNCTLSLLKSSLRKSPIPKDGEYARQGSEDDRFVDYIGAVQSIVTSTGNNDGGLFEANLRDERFLPFEGAGAESTWKIDLPQDYRSFDYATISDVILHIRYTARQGVEPGRVKTALDDLFQDASWSNLMLLFSLPHDFPTEWSTFVTGKSDFTSKIRRDYFPYFTQGRKINIEGFVLYDALDMKKHHVVSGDLTAATDGLSGMEERFTITLGPDVVPPQVLTRTAKSEVFLIVRYSLSK